jgi:hypothetical protein
MIARKRLLSITRYLAFTALIIVGIHKLGAQPNKVISDAEIIALAKQKVILKLSADFARASAESPSELNNDKSMNHLKDNGWILTRHEYLENSKPSTVAVCHNAPLDKQRYVFLQGQGSLIINGKSVDIDIIAFRGSKVKQNYFYTDFKLKAVRFLQPLINAEDIDSNMHVHCGFNQYLFSASENPSQALETYALNARANRLNSQKLYIVTGHSLGGATANLFAASIYGTSQQMKNDNNLYLVTFGQPAVGGAHYRDYYKIAFKHYLRFINQGDIVPYSTNLFGYKPFGLKIICKSRAYCKKDKGQWLQHCDKEGGLHSVKEYLAIVKGLTQKGLSYAKSHHCTFST